MKSAILPAADSPSPRCVSLFFRMYADLVIHKRATEVKRDTNSSYHYIFFPSIASQSAFSVI